MKIVCYGDSNTFGYRPGKGGQYGPHTRWPGALKEWLGEGYEIIEEGLCGRTTAFEDVTEPGRCGLDGLRDAVQGNAPLDLLIVMLGSNDCKIQFQASAEQITDGLEQLITKARGFTDAAFRILLIAPAVLTEQVARGGFASEFDRRSITVSAELAQTYEALAERSGCGFLDGTSVTKVSEIDGLHLDEKGHERLAEAVCAWVKGMR